MTKVFINGTFDVLHPGHMRLITFASNSGEYLKIAIDSDRRVKSLKGENRPINNQDTRATMLFYVKGVDEVSIFDSDEELINTIRNYQPDIMIVGSDYKNKKVIGSEYAKNLLFFDRIEEYSSTKVIEKIQYENTLCPTDMRHSIKPSRKQVLL
jgi:D-beta-D-heptose 7-phosphate kinase/D-beta-D-heptose 1-phosphate adenosyltransferase